MQGANAGPHLPDPPFERMQFFSQRHAPFKMPIAHWHSQIELNFLNDGEMTYLVGGQILMLPARRLSVFWGATPHQVLAREGRNDIIVIYVPIADFLRLSLPSPFRRKLVGGAFFVGREPDPVDAILTARWHEDLASGREDLKELARQEVACRLRRFAVTGYENLRSLDVAATPERAPAGRDLERVREMAVMIATRFQHPLSVAEIATAAGVHPNYAMVLFRRVLGMTISDYLTRQRLSRAQAMLIDTELPITRVAQESGFQSQSRFYEVFAQWVGKSPARYRNELVNTTVADDRPFKPAA